MASLDRRLDQTRFLFDGPESEGHSPLAGETGVRPPGAVRSCTAIGSPPQSPSDLPVRHACVLHATLSVEDCGGGPRPRTPTDRRPWLAIRGGGARFDSLIPRPSRGASRDPALCAAFRAPGFASPRSSPGPSLRVGLRPPVAPWRAAARRAVARRPPAASAQGSAPGGASLPPSLERGSCRAMPRVRRAGSNPTERGVTR